MKNKLKNSKGITLIALVITIIVLLILAGVAISMLAGDNGILRQAAKAKEETEKGSEKEANDLARQELYLEISIEEVTEDNLKSKGYEVYPIDDKYAITKGKSGFVLDNTLKKILAQSSSEIVKDIYDIKLEYNQKKETLDNVTTLNLPYNNTDKYEVNNNAVKEKLNSYKPEEYTMIIKKGYIDNRVSEGAILMCLYDEDKMTEEKIIVCEAMGIYLLGDINGDNVVDWWDYSILKEDMTVIRNDFRK